MAGYLAGHDFSDHTRRAIRNDLRKFVRWFTQANGELFTIKRVTLRDVTDFRNWLHRDQRQAVASVNRALVIDSPLPRLAGSAGQLAREPSKGSEGASSAAACSKRT